MRKSELAGLPWTDVDLAAGTVLVRQQLLSGGITPVFITTKGKRVRVIDIAPETVELLKTHRVNQAEIKMRHRQVYCDFGLVFAKELSPSGRRKPKSLGIPLAVNNIGEREFAELIEEADVPRITVHGLPTPARASSWQPACRTTSYRSAWGTRTLRRRWTSTPTLCRGNTLSGSHHFSHHPYRLRVFATR